ncbi:cytochrome c oxidase subunit NDUFA4-like [Lineus longissimus]|uniref:cytochrome c oxidase subunit NDUFA4-like n=1 Tax=Lineus longissimus TaxID=88925 RepID=UPI002B4C364B
MQGLSLKSLKKHPALIPLYFCVGVGVCGAAFYTTRLATRCPDVSWDKKKNPYPWQKLGETGQYKFYSPVRDYKKLKYPSERPDIESMEEK